MIQSCDISNISNEDMNNLNNLKTDILIEDGSKDDSLNSVRVYLTDGKKQIIEDKIKILLNNIPMKFYRKKDLYYTNKSYYITDNLSRNDSYYFEIVLPNGSKYPLAYIKPLKRDINAKFIIPKTNYRNEDIIIEWENINWENKVKIWKLVHEKKRPNYHSGGPYAETTIHKFIKTENGKFTIPKLFFQDSLTIADFIQLSITSSESGLINPELIKNSTVIYNYTREETIELTEITNANNGKRFTSPEKK